MKAIADSAVFYVFRCLVDDQVPATSGLLRPIKIIAPEGTIVNARPPSAVAGGNVEASQRIVDTNNVTFGGRDTRPGRGGAPFAYYETIAGGMGARPGLDGESGIHTHMTNSLNTPVEVFEHAYPVRVKRYGIRYGSGGAGKFRGGNGIIREIELLAPMQVGMLSDRRKFGPYGLAGGKPGAKGKNEVVIAGQRKTVPAKGSFYAPAGAVVRIESPGGGGWGKPPKRRR